MAQQEEGWPLGLEPVNVRVGLVRNHVHLCGSPTSSTDSSSDLDTQSTGSFFHDKSTTLGTLMGVSNTVNLPRRSAKGKTPEISLGKKNIKSKTWSFSLCPRDTTDAHIGNTINTPSLAHFLEIERRAGTDGHRISNQCPFIYGPDMEPNSLFVNGCIAPPSSSPWFGAGGERRDDRGVEGDGGYGAPLMFSCMCG